MSNARKTSNRYNADFPTRLREMMEDTNTTQEILAKETGMTRQSISTYMDGSVLPNIEKLKIICEYFKIPSDYLLGLIESKSKDVTVQYITDKIGLSEEAINNLEEIYHGDSKLFKMQDSDINFLDYMLSNQNFTTNYIKRLRDYFGKKLADYDITEMYKKSLTNEKTDIAHYLYTKFMQDFAEDCYNDFYFPIARDNAKQKQKPGRKRNYNKINNDNNE